jgi:hypothetical protein
MATSLKSLRMRPAHACMQTARALPSSARRDGAVTQPPSLLSLRVLTRLPLSCLVDGCRGS